MLKMAGLFLKMPSRIGVGGIIKDKVPDYIAFAVLNQMPSNYIKGTPISIIE